MSRKQRIILAVSLIVQMVFFAATVYSTDVRHLDITILGGDGYRYLAENLHCCQSFSSSRHLPLLPDSARTPAYPLFLAGLYAVTGNWIAVLFFQALLLSVAPLVLYEIGKRFSERLAFVAALVFAIEPTRALWSSLMMTDALFTLVLLSAVWVFFRWMDAPSWKSALGTGALLGLLTLIRPIGLLMWIIFLFIAFWREGWRLTRPFLVGSSLLLFGFAAFVAPWAIRNKILFDTYALSAIGDYSLAYANAIQFKKAKTGEPLGDLIAEYNARVPQVPEEESVSLKYVPIYRAFAGEIIGADPFGYLKFHIVKTIPLFMTDGLRSIASMLGLPSSQKSTPNLSGGFLQGRLLETLASYVREQPLEVFLLIIGSAFWSLVSLGFFVGAGFTLYEKPERRREWILLFLVSCYVLAAASGPVAQPRYRLPVEGFMFLFALFAANRLRRHFRR